MRLLNKNKKILERFLMIFLLMIFSANIFSQKIEYKKLPQPVKMNFETMFQNVKVKKCEADDKKNYTVQFKKENNKMYARYNVHGYWLCTGVFTDTSATTADIKENLQTNHAGAKIIYCGKIQTPYYKNLYEILLSEKGIKNTYWFHEEGLVIKSF